MADDQYILQFGLSVGIIFILGTLFVSHTQLLFFRSIYIFAILALLYPVSMDYSEEILHPKEGLYFNNNNVAIRKIAQNFEGSLPLYLDLATPLAIIR
jgi:hypothetical protein